MPKYNRYTEIPVFTYVCIKFFWVFCNNLEILRKKWLIWAPRQLLDVQNLIPALIKQNVI